MNANKGNYLKYKLLIRFYKKKDHLIENRNKIYCKNRKK